MLIKIIILVLSLQMSFAIADPKISNYKKYPKTNSEYKLQKLDASFVHPWGITSLNIEEMKMEAIKKQVKTEFHCIYNL